MRPRHGANLQEYLFAPNDPGLMSIKSAQITSDLNQAINFGEVVQVGMTTSPDNDAVVSVTVHYRVYEGGAIQVFTHTFTGFLDQESLI